MADCLLPRALPWADLPLTLRRSGRVDPALSVTVRGRLDLLRDQLIGFFCSESVAGGAILATYDLAVGLGKTNAAFIGGFQSSMEREFLTFVLRGSARVVVCPAREISQMRLPGLWKSSLETGQMLVLSTFTEKVRRPTRKTVAERNALIVDLATSLLVPHAEPGGKVERLCEAAMAAGKPVFTLRSQRHRLGELGATEAALDLLPPMLTAT